MTKAQKIKTYLHSTNMINVSELCKLCKIDRLRFHRWLQGGIFQDHLINEDQINDAYTMLKKFGLK